MSRSQKRQTHHSVQTEHPFKSLKNLKTNPPPPGPDKAPDAPAAAAVGEAESKENSQRQKPEFPLPPVSIPDKPAPAAARAEEKASQREETSDLFTSPSFQLADDFAGDEQEFVDAALRRKRAHRFRDIIAKLFHSVFACDRYPDADLRLQACVEVIRIWIDIVKARDNPAESPGFISTEPGLRALACARKQVFGSADEYQEIELDPTVQAMWEERFGENWREKRFEMMNKGCG